MVGGEGVQKILCQNRVFNYEAGSISQERKDLKHKARMPINSF